MATPQNGEPSRIIGAISKFAGTLVGTAVITGRRIIGSAAPPSKGPSDKPKGKTMQAPSKRKKKVVRRKGTGSSGKSVASKNKPAPSPAKKGKGVAPRKKMTSHKTKKKTETSKVSSRFQNNRSSKVDAEMNVPIGEQEPHLQLPVAEAEMADKKFSSANVSPNAGTEKNGTIRTQKPSVPIIEYNNKPKKAVVATTSVL